MTCSHTHPYDDPSRLHSKLLPNVCRPIFGLYPWKYLAHYYRRPGPLQHFQFVDIGMARSKSNPLYDKSTEALLFSIVAPNIACPFLPVNHNMRLEYVHETSGYTTALISLSVRVLCRIDLPQGRRPPLPHLCQ